MSLKGRPSAVTSATLVVGRTILAVVFGGTANSRWSWPRSRLLSDVALRIQLSRGAATSMPRGSVRYSQVRDRRARDE